jgi:hypothetical protein|tara:strand:- start:1541 stop:1705 length:165 start_codon:yes stop_codon:yes gene_type:complete
MRDYHKAKTADARIDIRVPSQIKEEIVQEAKERGVTVTELLLESYRMLKDVDIR